jgi:hypothetical protein
MTSEKQLIDEIRLQTSYLLAALRAVASDQPGADYIGRLQAQYCDVCAFTNRSPQTGAPVV